MDEQQSTLVEEHDYTGEVSPGGPVHRRELPALTIRKMSVSEMHNNVYLLTCRATGEQLLVDAADDAPRCLALVALGGDESVPYVVMPYVDRMDLAYAAADAVVCRSGANTVCELTAVGLPAVYVPLPIGNGEQRLNAAGVVAAGGGLLVEDLSLIHI